MGFKEFLNENYPELTRDYLTKILKKYTSSISKSNDYDDIFNIKENDWDTVCKKMAVTIAHTLVWKVDYDKDKKQILVKYKK